jgi:hypothetical protein
VPGVRLGEVLTTAGNKWIQSAISHPGALTATAKKAGAVHGGKIDKAWTARAAKGNGLTAKRARLAQTLGKMRG